jgi:hypothetical protein
LSFPIDYYWRDFKGKIPEDAVEGGLSPSGRPFYVAQAYFPKTGLLPANVFPGKSEALSSGLGKEMKTNAHVKVTLFNRQTDLAERCFAGSL